MKKHKTDLIIGRLRHHLWVLAGAVVLTFLFFLVLPLMQTISKPPRTDLLVQNVVTANVPPPPPPEEEEAEEEAEQEEPPPELAEEAPPLDLSQLELALNPGFNEGAMGGDFAVSLKTIGSGEGSEGDSLDALFSMADLDQKPRVLYQPGPALDKKVRKKAPGTVYILFIVNQNGRVEKPMVQSSSDPVFEKPALAAVRQWKFEPGKRQGKPVRFRMRVPITFPKG
ncbi:MAG: TonB family protein [Candidatus Brocadiaceae bacterium]|nr:TonB family protein [Candidatus Brocadiaceae bacterium]